MRWILAPHSTGTAYNSTHPPMILPSIEYRDHTTGAAEVAMFFPGLDPSKHLRDGEGWATEKCTINTHNGTHLDASRGGVARCRGGVGCRGGVAEMSQKCRGMSRKCHIMSRNVAKCLKVSHSHQRVDMSTRSRVRLGGATARPTRPSAPTPLMLRKMLSPISGSHPVSRRVFIKRTTITMSEHVSCETLGV